MAHERKKGRKYFWECRVLERLDEGCIVEMTKTGLRGFMPKTLEGPKALEVGQVYQMECIACPFPRVNKEKKGRPWRTEPHAHRPQPYFSHLIWLAQQVEIKKAQEFEEGEIVTGTVFKHLKGGMLIELEGEPGEMTPKAHLSIRDFSRKNSGWKYVHRMF